MTDSEITALAREYAEFTDMSPVDKKNISAICECFLKYTLRRYALVEKEAIRKEYNSVKDTPDECNYEELGATWDEWPYLSRFFDEGYKLGQKDTVNFLFPEIAKDVQEPKTNHRSHENSWCENEL